MLDVGNSTNTVAREIVIGNNVLSVPENMIRLEKARRDGVTDKLELFMHWPDMSGYSPALRDAFNDADASRSILFVTIQEKMMSRDMSGRFEPIYRRLILEPASRGSDGLVIYQFKPDSGYANEVLAVGRRDGQRPFVTRCLTGEAAAESLAACERDIDFGDELSATYRFSDRFLVDWSAIDLAVRKRIEGFVQVAD